jgi:branched-chain amino acid transport system ATP-binding protein
MTYLLDARGISKSYGAHHVLKNLDLGVAEGEVHAVIGPNGAGKTTFIKVLSGEVPPIAGTVQFAGRDVTALPAHRRAAIGIGRTFQVARVFSEMSVRENLVVAVEASGKVKPGSRMMAVRPHASVLREADALLEEVGLARLADQQASTLAHGDKKRLELTLALALRPRLLFLDEPTAGMSIADRRASTAQLARIIRERGLSLLLTEHDMEVVFGLGTRLTVLNYGAVLASGTPEAVRNDPKVRRVYLGKARHAPA